MSDVGGDLRRATADAVRASTPMERIELALRLGDSDVELYRAAHGVDAEEARRRLQAARQRGRRPSVTAARER